MDELLNLGYHYVRDEKAPGPNCPPDRFRKHLQFFKDNGWEILTCGEITERFQTNFPLPEKCATLSFDDGLKDGFSTAFPILQEFGAPATFFIIACTLQKEIPPVIGFQILISQLGAERIEKKVLPLVLEGTPYATLLDPARYDICNAKSGEPPEMRRIKWVFNHFPSPSFKQDILEEMFSKFVGEGSQQKIAADWFITADQQMEMAKNGMEIASHSVTHSPFDIAGASEIERELADSKTILSQFLGIEAATFAWPFGIVLKPRIVKAVFANYRSAWNFYSPAFMKAMPPQPYELINMPRLHEGLFLP